mmetsp:Transcript_1909/g.11701  ORF Transcript_1909/g.11701 Transcript_1909/m.11701 type:complete len:253 (+) Transcript_1909:2620-3378(+)
MPAVLESRGNACQLPGTMQAAMDARDMECHSIRSCTQHTRIFASKHRGRDSSCSSDVARPHEHGAAHGALHRWRRLFGSARGESDAGRRRTRAHLRPGTELVAPRRRQRIRAGRGFARRTCELRPRRLARQEPSVGSMRGRGSGVSHGFAIARARHRFQTLLRRQRDRNPERPRRVRGVWDQDAGVHQLGKCGVRRQRGHPKRKRSGAEVSRCAHGLLHANQSLGRRNGAPSRQERRTSNLCTASEWSLRTG